MVLIVASIVVSIATVAVSSATIVLVVAVLVVVSSSGWALAFFVAPFGPAFVLEVAKLVAVVTFNILLVTFLRACSESVF